MTLNDLRTYLRSMSVLEGYSITLGVLDGDKLHQIALYPRRNDNAGRRCVGGSDCTTYDTFPVDILIHGNTQPMETFTTAEGLCGQLRWLEPTRMGDASVICVSGCNSAIPCGKDRRGVYEYVIHASIMYLRGE